MQRISLGIKTLWDSKEGNTSGKRDSFRRYHYGSISEVDRANVMWESQLQITAETTSPVAIPTIFQSNAAPPTSAKPSFTMMLEILRDKVKKKQQFLLCQKPEILQ